MSPPSASTATSAPLAVAPVHGARDVGDWLDLPERIQGKDPCFIAPLRIEQKRLLDRPAHLFE